MDDKKLETVKTVVSCVASIGIGVIVENTIKANTPSTVGKVVKFLTVIGGLVLSGILCTAAEKYVSNTIDNGAKAIKKLSQEQPPEEETVE